MNLPRHWPKIICLLGIAAAASATGCADRSTAPKPASPAPVAPTDAAKTGSAAPQTVAGDDFAYMALCGGEMRNLSEVLAPIVADLVEQKIPYTRDPSNEWPDCSGNFVPVYDDDIITVTGTSSDLRRHRQLIRPGAVLWYSRGRPDSSGGTDGLFVKGDTANRSHINDMGTVTSVRHDDNGEVIGYSIYHGRGRADQGTPASVTTHHYWQWPDSLIGSGKEYPSLGYWSQRLVGIGTLVPVASVPDPLTKALEQG